MEVEYRCSGNWAEGRKLVRPTFCLVELGECLVTNIAVSEEHAELTSAQTGPNVFEGDYQHVSEESKTQRLS